MRRYYLLGFLFLLVTTLTSVPINPIYAESDLDKDGSGAIDFDEFLDMMTARMSDKDSREDIGKVFRLFDDEIFNFLNALELTRHANGVF